MWYSKKRINALEEKINELEKKVDEYMKILNVRPVEDCEPQENYLPLSKSQTAR